MFYLVHTINQISSYISISSICAVSTILVPESILHFWMDGAREVVENALDSCLERNITDWGKIKTVVKDALSEFLWKRTKRSPMILPIIMEA